MGRSAAIQTQGEPVEQMKHVKWRHRKILDPRHAYEEGGEGQAEQKRQPERGRGGGGGSKANTATTGRHTATRRGGGEGSGTNETENKRDGATRQPRKRVQHRCGEEQRGDGGRRPGGGGGSVDEGAHSERDHVGPKPPELGRARALCPDLDRSQSWVACQRNFR